MTCMPLADLLALFARLFSVSIWRTLRRMPRDLLGATAACLALAGIVWAALGPEFSATMRGAALGVGLGVCYAAAGLLWGLHRAVRAGVGNALLLYEAESPKVLDLVLAPLVANGPLHEREISLVEAKRALNEFARSPLSTEESPRWFAVVGRAAGRLARWCVRRQLALIESFLDALEAKGETHLSARSLKDYLRDQMVQVSLAAARSRIRLADCAVAASVFFLLTIPAGMILYAR